MLTVENPNNFNYSALTLLDCAEGNYQDAYYTLLLFEKYKLELEKLNLWKLYDSCFAKLNEVFARIEFDGMLVDEKELDKSETDLINKLDGPNKILHEIAGEINIKSNNDLKDLFFLEKGKFELYPPFRTDKGNPALDSKSLDFIDTAIKERIDELEKES